DALRSAYRPIGTNKNAAGGAGRGVGLDWFATGRRSVRPWLPGISSRGPAGVWGWTGSPGAGVPSARGSWRLAQGSRQADRGKVKVVAPALRAPDPRPRHRPASF